MSSNFRFCVVKSFFNARFADSKLLQMIIPIIFKNWFSARIALKALDGIVRLIRFLRGSTLISVINARFAKNITQNLADFVAFENRVLAFRTSSAPSSCVLRWLQIRVF
jgi:hypothetical protein